MNCCQLLQELLFLLPPLHANAVCSKMLLDNGGRAGHSLSMVCFSDVSDGKIGISTESCHLGNSSYTLTILYVQVTQSIEHQALRENGLLCSLVAHFDPLSLSTPL